ncbi:MAG: bifunctional oligoribonuclease/PAP phosphatase NrnA [Spirochaetales bacterium]|nr:bifunctional oligoribonuclease/PAP phosphatase NrnA [Spirochaetales bacterium]
MTFDELLMLLRSNDNFLLVSHADPDGDALGSEYALCQILRSLGKKVTILNADRGSHRYLFFDEEKLITSLEEGTKVPPDLNRKILVLLDTSDYQHTGLARSEIIPLAGQVLIIDHHEALRPPPAPFYIDNTAAATCQIVFELAQALKVKIELPMAKALFMGLVFDTGSFIYSKTSARTFEIAKDLVLAGVKPKEIHAQLYETIEPQRMKLLAKVQSTLTLTYQDRIAYQILTQVMLQESGAEADDAVNFIDYPLKCQTVLVSLFLKEVAPGQYRCSLRSKDNINVANIALKYGGGGHQNAAGFACPVMPLEKLKEMLIRLLEDLLSTGR